LNQRRSAPEKNIFLATLVAFASGAHGGGVSGENGGGWRALARKSVKDEAEQREKAL